MHNVFKYEIRLAIRNNATSRSLVGESGFQAHPLKRAINGVVMPLYEHVVISRQDLSNAQAEGLLEHFGKVLSDNGGKVVAVSYTHLRAHET